MHRDRRLDFDDVVAGDFVVEDDLKYIRRMTDEQDKELKILKKRINKDVAHLTYDRLNREDEGKDWYYVHMLKYILCGLKEFCEKSNSRSLDAEIHKEIEEACNRIEELMKPSTESAITESSLSASTDSVRVERNDLESVNTDIIQLP